MNIKTKPDLTMIMPLYINKNKKFNKNTLNYEITVMFI